MLQPRKLLKTSIFYYTLGTTSQKWWDAKSELPGTSFWKDESRCWDRSKNSQHIRDSLCLLYVLVPSIIFTEHVPDALQNTGVWAERREIGCLLF